jgi:hypothetical protein
MIARMAVLVAVGVVVGCGGASNSSLRADLGRRASFDMECAESDLSFAELSTIGLGLVTSYGVRGCGSKATYVLDTRSNTWVLNSRGVQGGAQPPASKQQ